MDFQLGDRVRLVDKGDTGTVTGTLLAPGGKPGLISVVLFYVQFPLFRGYFLPERLELVEKAEDYVERMR